MDTLKEVLLHKLPAAAYVEITDSGWRVGFTYIDYEDLFIRSLNPKMLDRKVIDVIQTTDKAFVNPIYEVKLA